jgi:hypothetical protein
MRRNAVFVVAVTCALLALFTWNRGRGSSGLGASLAAEKADGALKESVANLQGEVNALRKLVPEQSVAMLAVAQQFTNLWSAAKTKNWPLAQFFVEETEEGIEWAVRIQPVRREPPADEVNLAAIYDSLSVSVFPELKASIAAHDSDRFARAYQNTLQGCYACHKAIGKQYLRPKVPADLATPVLNFDPQATWPQ